MQGLSQVRAPRLPDQARRPLAAAAALGFAQSALNLGGLDWLGGLLGACSAIALLLCCPPPGMLVGHLNGARWVLAATAAWYVPVSAAVALNQPDLAVAAGVPLVLSLVALAALLLRYALEQGTYFVRLAWGARRRS